MIELSQILCILTFEQNNNNKNNTQKLGWCYECSYQEKWTKKNWNALKFSK